MGSMGSIGPSTSGERLPRVALVSSGLGRVSRGVETWTRQLAGALHRHGVDVTVLCGGALPRGTLDCPTVRLPTPFRDGAIRRVVRGGSWYRRVAWEQYLFAAACVPLLGRYDLIHTQENWTARALVRARRLGLLRSPILFNNGVRGQPDVLTGADYVQDISPAEARRTRGYGVNPVRCWMIPHFVDTDRFRAGDRSAARRRLGLPEDGFIVLAVGAITRDYKRMHHLLEGLRALPSGGRPVTGVVVGATAPDTDEVVAWGNGLPIDVRFHVDRPWTELPDFYRAADLFVLPTHKEVFGIAFVEAMSSGLPVIGDRHETTAWIVGNGGETVDCGSPAAIAEAIARYRDDPDLVRHRGDLARKRALEVYSEERVVTEIIEMYAAVLVEQRRAETASAAI